MIHFLGAALLTINYTASMFAMQPQPAAANEEEKKLSDYAGWHRQYTQELQGANIAAAIDFLKAKGIKPRQQVVVGIVDSGVDTTNVNLQDALWTNPLERADGRDNDGNGYADDLHGWNFLGTADGTFNMISAGTEEYRQFKRLHPKYKNVKSRDDVADDDKQEYDFYQRMRKKAGINGYLQFYEYALQKQAAVAMMDSILGATPGVEADTLSVGYLGAVQTTDSLWTPLCQMLLADLLRTPPTDKWPQFVKHQADAVALMRQRIESIEGDKDKRLLMGDDMEDADDRYYGNPTLTIEGCEHGTFVAGIIGGSTPQDARYGGVAEGQARLMIVRASPDGDEYDKDVASAIRYAVDNGARVINISLGKYYSPQPQMVNDAIRYALDNDVVVVHAAGNNRKDLDSVAIYPSGVDSRGRFFDNFIRVGATDEQGHVAAFSNYGSQQVHLFAPGTKIASVFPGNKYDLSQGTSLSAPVVTGIVALLRSYFPFLRAAQIRQLLVDTARPMDGTKASISGGVVDMLAAVTHLVDHEKLYRADAVSDKYVSPAVYNLSPSPSWVDGSSYLIYSVKRQDTREHYLVDARTGRTEPLLKSTKDFLSQYHSITGQKLAQSDLRFYSIEIERNDATRFYWRSKKHRLAYNRRTGVLALDTRPEKAEKERRHLSSNNSAQTADSLFTMLGDRYNLHVRDNRTGQVRQLTTDGRQFSSYCTPSAKDTLREGSASGFWKGHSYFCMVYDDSEVGYLNLLHNMSNPPRLEQKKMPLPGGNAIRRYRLYWYNADSGEGRLLPIAPNRDYNIQLDYTKADDRVFFLRRSRSVDTLELCRINPVTGDVKVIISEVCQPHANVNLFKYHLLDHGRQVLWWSERTGRGNYYLYDGETGRLLNRVTQGDQLVCGRIERIDTLARSIIFAGYGQEPGDPNYTYYYKVGLNGRNQQLLTYGYGNHSLQPSRDGHWAIDQYSRMDMPTVYNTVSLDRPKQHHEFYRIAEADAQKAGWVKPTLVCVKAADEQTDLYGVMYLSEELRAQNGKAEGKYPIISNVYPGPQDDQIPRSFTVDDNGNQSLAELGFVVVNVQPRGSSPLRGRDFYCYGYGNLRDYPVADDRHTIESLASQYPFIDLDRVGIYGHSGGGFETVTAMLTYPDFYKVGVSASGNHDNNTYIQWWAETFHGYGRPIPTNMELASRLKGRLLLMTGEVDENVPVASTVRLADALQRAGKRFDLMVFPEQGHGLYGSYYQNAIRYYFLDHLVKPEQFDIDIVNHK